MPTVQDVLKKKGNHTWSVVPTTSVRDATREMNDRHIGSLLVVSEDNIVGIFTERDVLRRIVAAGADPDTVRVLEVMTTPVAYATPDMKLSECKSIFTDRRIRHLPVIDSGRLAGIITSGDILGFEADDLKQTVQYLEEYIHS